MNTFIICKRWTVEGIHNIFICFYLKQILQNISLEHQAGTHVERYHFSYLLPISAGTPVRVSFIATSSHPPHITTQTTPLSTLNHGGWRPPSHHHHALNRDPKIIIRSRYIDIVAVLSLPLRKRRQSHKKQSDIHPAKSSTHRRPPSAPSILSLALGFPPWLTLTFYRCFYHCFDIADSVACNLSPTRTNQPIESSIQRIILTPCEQTHNIQIKQQPTEKGIIDRI